MKITYKELIHSDTAVTKGINNTPTEDIENNIIELCEWLNEKIAPHYAGPVRVNSGYRCIELNKEVGGASISHHLTGYACDLTCSDVRGLRDIIKNNYMSDIDQLIYYPKKNFIHISVHPRKRGEYLTK